ncbi:MAG: hypothetical protein HY769_02030, partial [Candidatus Stahlbacteria bacterium]|nr:hypothetical protein [Candidatus Stahlbacteria bacterium]
MYKYICMIVLLPSFILGEVIEKEIMFSIGEVRFSKCKGYDVITLGNYGYTDEIGAPMLPCAGISLIVPPGATVTNAEIISSEIEELPGTYNIFPVQPAIEISSGKVPDFVQPNLKIYSNKEAYPQKIIEYSATGTMSGYRLAGLVIHPIQYIPAAKKVVFYSSIRVKVYYELDILKIKRMPERKAKLFAQDIKSLVINPEDVDMWMPPIKPLGGSIALPAENWEYVMVVGNSSDSVILDPLRLWKQKKGVPSKIVNTGFIYSNYSGSDNQAKIKNFIADAETTWGATWVVLCGDVNVVPMKELDNGYTANFPSDHYYADTDPTGGRPQPDYEDVWVSRASINNAQECSTFVKKTLIYEKNPSFGYNQSLIYYPSIELYDFAYYGYSADTIAKVTPTPSWKDSIRYNWVQTLTRPEVQSALQSGIYFCHVSAHGGPEGWGHSSIHEMHQIADADAMTNFPNLFIFNAISCNIARIDDTTDCYTEHMQNNPNGGTAGIIGNIRSGLGGYAYQEDKAEGYDVEFYRQLCLHNVYNFAKTEGMAHNAKVPRAQQSSECKYSMYCHIALGDPEMPMWTNAPALLTVTYLNAVEIGTQNFLVKVKDGAGLPIPDARVCLMANDVYTRGYTNASGEITLPISPSQPETLWVTVTTHNFIPYEGYATVGLEPEITVVSPNGGEEWFIGTNDTIRWQSMKVESVKIGVSRNGGTNWDEIVNSTPSDGEYVWPVIGPEAEHCLIKVTDVNSSTSDISNGEFIITPIRTITVNKPNGGEQWCIDRNYNIEWSSTGKISSVKVELSRDNGWNWVALFNSTPNDGSENWTAVGPTSDSCKVRITSTVETNVRDISDGMFGIKEFVGVVINLPDTIVSPGDTVIIPVKIDEAKNMGIMAAELEIEYDSSFANLLEVSKGEIIPASWVVVVNNTIPGEVKIAAAGSDTLTDSAGIFLGLKFYILPVATGSCSLHFVSAKFNTGNPIANPSDGRLRVGQICQVGGKVTYYSNSLNIADVRMGLTGDATMEKLTDISGKYIFDYLLAGNYQVTPVKEDAGFNPAVTSFDAVKVLRKSVGLDSLNEYQVIAGDVSGNGTIQSYDASLILRYRVGIIQHFPVGDWAFMPQSKSYTPLDEDKLNEDYVGILYGDV